MTVALYILLWLLFSFLFCSAVGRAAALGGDDG